MMLYDKEAPVMRGLHRNRKGKRWVLLCTAIWLMNCALPVAAGQAPDPKTLRDLAGASFLWAPPEGMADPRFGDGFQVEITDRERLSALETLLGQAYPTRTRAGCPFYGAALLKLKTSRGQEITLELAWDSCTIFRWGEHEYNYKPPAFRKRYDVYPHNDVLFDLFTWQEKARSLDGNDLLAIEGLYQDWLSVHGQPWLWPFETWVRFSQTFEPPAKAYARLHPAQPQPAWLRLMRRHYTWYEEGDLPLDDAVGLAVKEVQKRFGFSQEEMRRRSAYARFARVSPERSEWLIHLLEGENPQGAPYVRIDANTGQILEMGRWPEVIDRDVSFLE